MNFLLTIVLTGLSFSAFSAEFDSITLLTPTPYKAKPSFGMHITSKAVAPLAPDKMITDQVVKRVSKLANDLAKYFPEPGGAVAFARKVSEEGVRIHLRENNDANLVKFFGHIGNNLIGTVADRILNEEGIQDPERRKQWTRKLLENFNSCISTSQDALNDGLQCVSALSDDLAPNAGIALVYELSKENLSGALPENQRTAFNNAQTDLYKSCMAKTKLLPSDVKGCALSAMKAGVLKVTDHSLSKTINEKAASKTSAQNIKKIVWPAFSTCTQSVGDGKGALKDQLIGCLDTLITTTGAQLVNDKITTTPAISSLMLPAEVKKLATEKSAQFKACAEDQKKKGARKDGLLDIDTCENAVTNDVTYKVVSLTLRKTANDSFKGDKSLSLKMGNEGVETLDKCWNNKQSETAREACLRKTILTFSKSMATVKLDKAIPSDMDGKSQLALASVQNFESCLEKELPKSISESDDMSKRIDACSAKLTRSVAIKVADHQIRSTASDLLTLEQTNSLVENLVNKDFNKCLGPTPTDESIQKCGDTLTLKAAKQITSLGFEKEVNGYLKKNGGVYALGLTQVEVDLFIKNLNNQTQICLDKRPAAVPAIDHVATCAKNSIKQIALFFGDIKFKQATGDMYKSREAELAEVQKSFKKNLDQCLNSKASAEFSITDYTKNLYVCSDKISSSTTLDVGQDQIESTMNKYLADRPGIDLSVIRKDIRDNILGQFKKCMATTPADNQGACTDSLKRDATYAIVLNYGRAETKAHLNSKDVPQELKTVEEDLKKCTAKPLAGDELSLHLDECTKQFALNFAKELGTLKLNHLLKSALGSEEFTAQKKNIDAALLKYTTCLDNLKSIKMSEGLTDKLTICTNGLEESGLALVKNSINNWMSTDQKDAATLMLKREFSAFIPCLSALLPSSPYTPVLEKNIESILKPVSVMFAQYIEYSPENAKSTLDGILKKLSTDLKDVATNPQSRKELVDFLYDNGTLDQFIKSMVRSEVKKAMEIVPAEDVPKELREILLQKQNYEDIFNTPEGEKIKKMVLEKILKPALIDQIEFSSPALTANTKVVKDNVITLLANSPNFGDKIVQTGVQTQINKMGGVKSFLGKMMYGAEAFDWSKVRLTPEGRAAENYIKENVLLPKFKGVPQTAEDEKKAKVESEELVTNAVKAYKKKKND